MNKKDTDNCCKNCSYALEYNGHDDFYCDYYESGRRAEKYDCEHFKLGTKSEEVDSRLQDWFNEHPGIQVTAMKCEKCGLYFDPSLGHDCEVPMAKEEIINNFLDWFFNQEVYGMDREKGCLLVGRDGRYVKALDVYRKEKK